MSGTVEERITLIFQIFCLKMPKLNFSKITESCQILGNRKDTHVENLHDYCRPKNKDS